jgi:hypothetical protein
VQAVLGTVWPDLPVPAALCLSLALALPPTAVAWRHGRCRGRHAPGNETWPQATQRAALNAMRRNRSMRHRQKTLRRLQQGLASAIDAMRIATPDQAMALAADEGSVRDERRLRCRQLEVRLLMSRIDTALAEQDRALRRQCAELQWLTAGLGGRETRP